MSHLDSPTAKAKLKAYIEADKPKKERKQKKIIHEIETKADFAGWCTQFPAPAKLFGVISSRWRASTARSPGRNGQWAAYTHDEWCKFANISARSTVKYQLDRIEEAGLIERAQHRHGGTAVKSFIRPTPLALQVTNAKEEEWKRLGMKAPMTIKARLRDLEEAYSKAYLSSTGHPLVTISKAERAALRAIFKELPDLAMWIVEETVENWVAFRNAVKADAGLMNAPLKPSVLFVRKHLQTAVEFVSPKSEAAVAPVKKHITFTISSKSASE